MLVSRGAILGYLLERLSSAFCFFNLFQVSCGWWSFALAGPFWSLSCALNQQPGRIHGSVQVLWMSLNTSLSQIRPLKKNHNTKKNQNKNIKNKNKSPSLPYRSCARLYRDTGVPRWTSERRAEANVWQIEAFRAANLLIALKPGSALVEKRGVTVEKLLFWVGPFCVCVCVFFFFSHVFCWGKTKFFFF